MNKTGKKPNQTPPYDNDKQKQSALNEKMPIIQCVCGEKILLLPDLKAMTKAIETHIQKCKAHKSAKNTSQTNAIQENLIAQALQKAAQIGTKTQNKTQTTKQQTTHQTQNKKHPTQKQTNKPQ